MANKERHKETAHTLVVIISMLGILYGGLMMEEKTMEPGCAQFIIGISTFVGMVLIRIIKKL